MQSKCFGRQTAQIMAHTDNVQQVAFLRGINLGRRKVRMDELRKVFQDAGFGHVATVLASGNVLFCADRNIKASQLGALLHRAFGFEIGVILRSVSRLHQIVNSDPFACFEGGRDTKFYLTMGDRPVASVLESVTGLPGDFQLARIDEFEYYAVAFLQSDGRFGAGLDRVEKLFRSRLITTRNWNTIHKILAKAGSRKT